MRLQGYVSYIKRYSILVARSTQAIVYVKYVICNVCISIYLIPPVFHRSIPVYGATTRAAANKL